MLYRIYCHLIQSLKMWCHHHNGDMMHIRAKTFRVLCSELALSNLRQTISISVEAEPEISPFIFYASFFFIKDVHYPQCISVPDSSS